MSTALSPATSSSLTSALSSSCAVAGTSDPFLCSLLEPTTTHPWSLQRAYCDTDAESADLVHALGLFENPSPFRFDESNLASLVELAGKPPPVFVPATTERAWPPQSERSAHDAAGSVAGDACGSVHAKTRRKAAIVNEEDRRLRSIAASARFRQRKKEKERALAGNFRLLDEENARLKKKIEQLETEVRWLRELLLEKAKTC